MAFKKIDITGLAVKSRPGWEIRAKELAKPEYFWVGIGLNQGLKEGLSKSEHKRLLKKLELVRQAATYMAAGMVKGMVKYTSDNYTVEKWIANVVGEGSDLFNYMILLADAFARKGKK